jgi:hypothetical protein
MFGIREHAARRRAIVRLVSTHFAMTPYATVTGLEIYYVTGLAEGSESFFCPFG